MGIWLSQDYLIGELYLLKRSYEIISKAGIVSH